MPRQSAVLVAVSLLTVGACAATDRVASNRPASTPAGATAQPPPTSTAAGVAALQSSVVGRMAHVPATTYVMGSNAGEADERPPHEVRVAAFDIDLTEVTVAQYAVCVREGGCSAAPTTIQFPGVTQADQQLYGSECNDDRPDRQDHPENCVDWSMADAYCRWAGERLPTEEEWEYAACGGNCDQALGERGGVGRVLGAERWPFTTPVARAWPGPFGLYDMAGNVWEWTASTYCPYDHPSCADSRRVVRGGSWSLVDYLFVRLTDRAPQDPSDRTTSVGFRCARSSP